MEQGDEVEVHPKNTSHQIQRQKDSGQHRERAHDVVGAAALHAEVHLHGGLHALLQATHVVDYPLNVLQHIAAAHLQQLALAGIGGARSLRPGLDGFYPILNAGALLFAHIIELVQSHAGLQQGGPVGEAGAGAQELVLPVVELLCEFAAQCEVAIHHRVHDAQHQVGGAGGLAGPCGARLGGRCCLQQFVGIGIAHGAVVGVHREQHVVKHRKPDRAGVDAPQDGRAAQARRSALCLGRIQGQGAGAAGDQAPEHQQVVLGGVVVVRRQLLVDQVGDVQIDQLLAAQLLQCDLDARLLRFKFGAAAGNPHIARAFQVRGRELL